jgi:hypothetical protein
MEVAMWICDRMTSGEALTPVDLRFLTAHGYPAKIQALADGTGDSWKSVLWAMLQGESSIADSRSERNHQLESIALAISKMSIKTAERFKKWQEQTGRGKSQYSVHLAKAKAANKE